MSNEKWIAKKGKLSELKDRSFDIEFWQSQSALARFDATWDLIYNYHVNVLKQDETTLRLNRAAVIVKQAQS